MAYLPSGLMTIFNGIFPTGPLVVPAGVILRPLTRMLEADEAEFPEELHPTNKTALKTASVMIVIVLKKTELTFLNSCDWLIKSPSNFDDYIETIPS
jgi:hypothetical protein